MTCSFDPAACDHLVWGVPDLAAGVAAVAARTGVVPAAGGKHPGWGTANALLALGPDAYLEILGPDPAQPRPSGPRPFGLDDDPLPRLLAWAVRAPDLEARVASARRRGFDPGPVRPMSRRRPDGSLLSWRLAIPADWSSTAGGLVPFLIDWGSSPSPARSAPAGCRLLGLRGLHPRPQEVRRALQALGIELEVEDGSPAGLVADLQTPAGALRLDLGSV